MRAAPILKVEGVKKYYPVRGGVFGGKIGDVRAVDGVSFEVATGKTLGIVGESGCGKSTLARVVMHLEPATAGQVLFDDVDLTRIPSKELFRRRRDIQMIFQDPYSSLNPRMTVGAIVREPLLIHRIGTKAEQIETAAELLETVGLKRDVLERYPHEFSGGQRQRIGIARALALSPKLVIADEPAAALDVSVQSQVLNLMVSLQAERNLTYVFISHDLSVVQHVSDNVAIMYLGRIVETGPTEKIFNRPAHPYTRALLQAIPVPDPKAKHVAKPIRGETPSPVSPPPGCPFHPRCPFAIDACKEAVLALEAVTGSSASGTDAHLAACIRKDEI